jgi:hypothetical protein
MTRVWSFQKPPRRPRSSARWQFCVGRASLRIARRTAAPLKTLAILASFCQNREQLLQPEFASRRAKSKARMADLRRESARRSYRSKAASCPVMSARMVANFCGPSGDDCTDPSRLVKSCEIKGINRRRGLNLSRALSLAASTASLDFFRLAAGESYSGSQSAPERRSWRATVRDADQPVLRQFGAPAHASPG